MDERRHTHEAGRFLVGYLLGLPIEGQVSVDDKESMVRSVHVVVSRLTLLRFRRLNGGCAVDWWCRQVKFYDTFEGNFNELNTPGPQKKKYTQDDILAHSILAITGTSPFHVSVRHLGPLTVALTPTSRLAVQGAWLRGWSSAR